MPLHHLNIKGKFLTIKCDRRIWRKQLLSLEYSVLLFTRADGWLACRVILVEKLHSWACFSYEKDTHGGFLCCRHKLAHLTCEANSYIHVDSYTSNSSPSSTLWNSCDLNVFTFMYAIRNIIMVVNSWVASSA